MEIFELFVKAKGYLPCPADPTLAVDNADFGYGDGTGIIGPSNCVAGNLADDTTTNVMMGMLPAQELALSPSDIVDGWGRRFSYAVDEDLTFSDNSNPLNLEGWADTDIDGEIEIQNENTTIVASDAAMVLISHGANGHGAWKGKGATQVYIGTAADKCSGGDPLENANTTLTGGSCPSNFDSSFIKKFRSSTYDDMLEYRIKWQFETPDS
jgi:hypothetical protein